MPLAIGPARKAGASTGGLDALGALTRRLPPELGRLEGATSSSLEDVAADFNSSKVGVRLVGRSATALRPGRFLGRTALVLGSLRYPYGASSVMVLRSKSASGTDAGSASGTGSTGRSS